MPELLDRREFISLGLGFLASIAFPSLALAKERVVPDRHNPIVIDKSERSVLIYTEVNFKGLERRNPHWGIVARNGKLQDKSILKAYCDAIDFHDALISIGAKPGNNLTEDKTGIVVAGDILDVTLFWDGSVRTYKLKDAFEDSTGRGFQIRFGGNRETALREKTGCITCLESCWIAITSNDRYPNISNFKRAISPNAYFKGNEAVLPKGEGSPVIVRYGLV